MKLNYEQIKAISTGAVRLEEDETGIKLYRYTREQEKLYEDTNVAFYNKSQATAGVKLVFRTDSESLMLKTKIVPRHRRLYFSIDVLVNGEAVGYLDSYDDVEDMDNYVSAKLVRRDYEKELQLGSGDKLVHIYLPWAVQTVIEEISLDDGAFVEPVKAKKTLLAFGDSITQGYDSLRPSNSYIARLARYLEADETNKAIGGECIFPALAETKDDFEPDYITVAFGTNDWSKKGRDVFQMNCKPFYQALRKNYPNSPIYAITPIWRADHQKEVAFGLFEDVEKDIREAVKGIDNLTVVRGYDFIPKDTSYFADARLHPNDKGFEEYFENLKKEIK